MLIIWTLLLFCWLVNHGRLKQTKWAALLIFLATVFVMGWRSVTYTPDNIAYASFFNLYSRYSLEDSWRDVLEWDGKDPIFFFLGNCFYRLGFNYRGWFVFISVIFMGGFCYLMYKRSQNFFLSIFFLVTLGYFSFAMTGLRQAMALGFCYVAFDFLCQRKPLWFAFFVAIGGLFHSSGWVFFLMYPLSFIPFGTKYIIAVLLAPVVAFLFPNLLGILVSRIAWNDKLAGYANVTTGLTISGYIIESAIFFLGIWCLEHQKNKTQTDMITLETHFDASVYSLSKDPFLKFGMNALAWGCIFRAFSINIDNFFRIAMYFSSYTPLVIPSVLNKLDERERRFALGAVMAICFVMSMRWGGHYSYFSMFEELPFE